MKLTLMLIAAVTMLSAEGKRPVKPPPPPPNTMPCPNAIVMPHVCLVHGF